MFNIVDNVSMFKLANDKNYFLPAKMPILLITMTHFLMAYLANLADLLTYNALFILWHFGQVHSWTFDLPGLTRAVPIIFLLPQILQTPKLPQNFKLWLNFDPLSDPALTRSCQNMPCFAGGISDPKASYPSILGWEALELEMPVLLYKSLVGSS